MNLLPLLFAVPIVLATTSDNSTEGRKQTVDNGNGDTTTMLWQPNLEHGVFDLKQTDANGKVDQWYQHYVDGQGKELISIVRESKMSGPAYQSIAYITTYTYNSSGNVAEEFEFFGNGVLRNHVIYRYDASGNFLRGDYFDADGKPHGSSPTPPEAHLYGTKK
jgi:hypothetical protein